MADLAEFLKYRGQWGGKIESDEEMWWSEPDRRLASGSRWRRARFASDVRQHFLLRFLRGLEPGARIADFGCGTGGTTMNFSSWLGTPIVGYDLFPTQLEIGRRFAEQIGSGCRFELLRSDGALPVADGTLDAILSIDVLGHVPDVRRTLADWARALKAGGRLALFTESSYSPGDRSLMARLAHQGMDMTAAVPEHISLHPREQLERWFSEAGFERVERFSANVWHFFFFPKDYVLLLEKHPGRARGWLLAARAWNRVSKIMPFYPWPFQWLRLGLTYLLGRKAFGSSYFYSLRKK